MTKSIKAYMDWSGGLNTDKSPDHLADNELATADNVVLELRGAASTRMGCAKLNLDSYGHEVTQLFEWTRNDGSIVLCAIADETLYAVDEHATLDEIQNLTSARVAWCGFQDKLYFLDGDSFYVYDGETCAEVEVDGGGEGYGLDRIRKCTFLLWNPRNYRFYAAGNPDDASALYYSEPNEPTKWTTTDRLYPSQAEGPITALTLFAHALMVFFTDSVWVWRGIDPESDAVWSKIPVPYGTSAPHSIALTPNSLTWLANGALVSVSPSILDYNLALMPGDELVRDLSADKVSTLVQGILRPEMACGVYDSDRGRYLLAYSDDPTKEANNRVLVCSWPLQVFTRFTGWKVNDWCLRRSRKLLFASNNYILAAETGYEDVDISTGEAMPIRAEIETKRFNFDLPFFIKRTTKLFVSGQVGGGQAPVVDIELRSSGLKGTTVFLPKVSFNTGMRWGDPWGTPWPFEDAQTVELKAKCRGERFQVRILSERLANSLNFYGVLFEYRPKARPKGVKQDGKTQANI